MGTVLKHHVPERVKPSFVIFDIRTLWAPSLRAPRCQKLQMTAYPVFHVSTYNSWPPPGYKLSWVKGLNVPLDTVISETMFFSYRSDDPTNSVKALSEGG